jgi:sortase A
MKPLRIFVALILSAGASLTARAMYLHVKAELAGVLIHRAWDKTVAQAKPQPPWPWADTYPVARLRIPRLGYDEIVLEGATPRTLAFGPARLFSGAGLGEPGNLELAGHRTSWFRPLEALEVGDEIQVQWFDMRKHELHDRTYTVDDIRIVAPEEVTLLAPTSEDALTLITCYPFGRSPRSPQRFVVLASPAGPSHMTDTSHIARHAQL